MAKIRIKSEKLTPFGGIFPIIGVNNIHACKDNQLPACPEMQAVCIAR